MSALFPVIVEPRPLRPYQERSIEMLRVSIGYGKRRPILKLATGSGKTKIAAQITLGALAKRHRVIFTVPRKSLIQQTCAALEREGIAPELIGVLQGQHSD